MERRTFLGRAAAVGSGLILSPRAFLRAGPPGDRIRAAVIGTGAQGQELIRTILLVPKVEIRAICDVWEKYSLARASALLREENVEHATYTDAAAMLEREKGLDAAIIATPDGAHADQAVACLEAGLHVYCERPMSNALDGARRMLEAARRSGKLLQIGHRRRSDPRYIHCASRVLRDAKLLGRIIAANGQWNRPAEADRGWPTRYALPEETLARLGYGSMWAFRNWRWTRAHGSGPLGELGSDALDVFGWFLDARPRRAIASGGIAYRDPKTHEWPDAAMAILEYETAKGTVRLLWQTLAANGHGGEYEKILGDQGTLMISEGTGMAAIYREPKSPDWDRWVDLGILAKPKEAPKDASDDPSAIHVVRSVGPASYEIPVSCDEPKGKPHLENFFAAIRGEARLACPGELAYESLVAAAKIREAIETGRRVEIPDEAFRA